MSTAIKLPSQFALNANFSAGPDAGTPTKVDPATPANGFVKGTGIAPQHINFHLNALASAARRPIVLAALRLRSLDLAGSTPSDTTAALAAISTSVHGTLVVKGDTNGVFRFVDSDLASQSGIAVAAITTQLRAIAINGSSRYLAVGTGGNKNAFSDNDGDTWTGGGSTGLSSALIGVVWDGTDFIVLDAVGFCAHSTNGAAWALCSGGGDPINVCANAVTAIAMLGATAIVAGATNTPSVLPAFAKSTDHGLTFATTGGTVPSPSNYVASGGLGGFAGDGGSEVYWLGNDGTTTLKFHASTNGASWSVRSSLPPLTLAGTAVPRLLLCRDTGLLVAAVAEAPGGIALCASLDRGLTWSEPVRVNLTSTNALGLAKGRLFATIGAKLYASDGIGSE